MIEQIWVGGRRILGTGPCTKTPIAISFGREGSLKDKGNGKKASNLLIAFKTLHKGLIRLRDLYFYVVKAELILSIQIIPGLHTIGLNFYN